MRSRTVGLLALSVLCLLWVNTRVMLPASASPSGSAPLREPPPLDGELEPALARAAPGGPGGLVVLTFGDKGYFAALSNFVAHARAAGVPYLVGAVDADAFRELTLHGATAYLTPLARDAAYAFNPSNSHDSNSWVRFARMRTGEVARIVRLGYAVMHSDTDVAWLRDPSPFLLCRDAASDAAGGGAAGARCSALREADVAVSSDNMSPGEDLRIGAAYAAGGTLNTGLLFVRPTAAGTAFATRWHETVSSPPPGKRFAPPGCCTSDQQVFGRMVRVGGGYPGLAPPAGAPTGGRLLRADGNLTLGSLPLALFMNGHSYFVQRAHERLGVAPFAVHATYTLDTHEGGAKAQRFREAGLWRADPPPPQGERFLAYNFSEPPEVAARRAEYARRGLSAANVDVHLSALEAYVAELRDALALARALGRTLLLPRWTCWCDRMWAGSDDIFRFGCMYPGAQDGNFVPFPCPMDHILSPAAWAKAGVGHRDAAFLDTLAERGVRPVEVLLLPRAQHRALLARPRVALLDALPLGTSDGEAAKLLAHLRAAPLLRLQHARGLLCALDAPQPFNDLAATLLRAPAWCSRCSQPCEEQLAPWLPAERVRAARPAPAEQHAVCFQPPLPAPLRSDGCAGRS